MKHEENSPFASDQEAAKAADRSMATRLQFGEAVRQGRRKAGLSPEQIESLTGIPESQLRDIEAGLIDPALSTMVALAKALGQNLSTLLA